MGQRMPSLAEARYSHAAVCYNDADGPQLMVVGGLSEDGHLKSKTGTTGITAAVPVTREGVRTHGTCGSWGQGGSARISSRRWATGR